MKNFEITSASTEEANGKLDPMLILRNTLNEKLSLIDYTDKTEGLFVIFQCFPKDIKTRKLETFKKVRRKTKTLELYLVLDYNKIMNSSDEENLTYIKEIFLQGCETFLKPMKAFDWEGFEKDIISLGTEVKKQKK